MTGTFGAARDAQLRRMFERYLPDRCAIVRKAAASVNSTTGGWTESESAHVSGVPCRVETRQSMPTERPVSGRQAASEQYNVLLSAVPSRWPGSTVEIRPTDRLVVTGQAAGTYEPAGAGGPVTDGWVQIVPCNKIT